MIVIRWELMCQSNVSEAMGRLITMLDLRRDLAMKICVHRIDTSAAAAAARATFTIIYENRLKYRGLREEIIYERRSWSEIKAKETWKRTLYWSHMRSVWYWVKRSGYTPNGMMMIARRASKPGSETKSRKKRFKFEMWRLTTLNCFHVHSLPMLSSIVLFARDWNVNNSRERDGETIFN